MAPPARTRRKPRTPRGEATRQNILDAAERLIGERGFHTTSVSMITREAGVAQGTFYLYFASKEEIFRELVRHLSHGLRAAIRDAVEDLDDRLAVEEAGIRAFLDFAAAHRNLYRIVLESEFIDPDLLRWYYEKIHDGYVEGLRDAIERGEVRDLDPDTLAWCLMGAAHFLGMRWVVWEGTGPPPGAIETLMEFLRPALAPNGGERA